MNEYIKAIKELAKAIEKVAAQTAENNTRLVKSFQEVEKLLKEKIANEIQDQEFKWGEKRELTDEERCEHQATPDILTEAREIQRNDPKYNK